MDAHDSGQLTFFNTHAGLAEKRTFKRFLMHVLPKGFHRIRQKLDNDQSFQYVKFYLPFFP